MATFFTADTHFGHKSAIPMMARPFASTSEMDEALIERWNAVVGSEDRVYHLGDFCFKGSKIAQAALDQLNGDIVLIRGNHDTENTQKLARWSSVHDILEVTVERRRLVLCHYPLLEWPGAYRGAWHLHGHTHGRVPPLDRRVDVGVDVWEYRPVDLATISARVADAPEYRPEDAYAVPSRDARDGDAGAAAEL